MNERDRVLAALKHEKTDIVPYHLDVTDEVNERLKDFFKDEDYFEKTGSHLAMERNESFTVFSSARYIIAPTHVMPNDIPTVNIIAFLEVVQNQP